MIHNSFRHFVVKEFWHIIRDSKTLLIVILMPVLQLIIFGYVITNEISDIHIAVYDKAQDHLSRKLIDELAASGYFLPVKVLHAPNEIEEVLKSDKVKMVVVCEPDFAENFIRNNQASVQIITDASEPNMAAILSGYAEAVIQSFARSQNPASMGKVPLDIRVRMMYNSELKGAYLFVPGTMMLILMLITAMMTSISITREKELGTMEILLVSPLKPWQIILGKVLPYVALGFFNTLVILLMAYSIFDIPMRGNLLLLLLVCLIFIVLALSMGILISTLSSSQSVAMYVSMFGLLLPTMLLTGFIYPIESMPDVLQWFCLIVPPRWFLQAIKTIMIKGEGFAFVWRDMAVMLAMIAGFLGLSMGKFKKRLE